MLLTFFYEAIYVCTCLCSYICWNKCSDIVIYLHKYSRDICSMVTQGKHELSPYARFQYICCSFTRSSSLLLTYLHYLSLFYSYLHNLKYLSIVGSLSFQLPDLIYSPHPPLYYELISLPWRFVHFIHDTLEGIKF